MRLENEENNMRNNLNHANEAKTKSEADLEEVKKTLEELNKKYEISKNNDVSKLLNDVYKAFNDLYKHIYREMFNGGSGYLKTPNDVFEFLDTNKAVKVVWSADFVKQLFLFRKISLLNNPHNIYLNSQSKYLEVSKYAKQNWNSGTQYIMFLEVFDMKENNCGVLYFTTNNSTDSDMTRMYNNNIDKLKNLLSEYNKKADLLYKTLNIEMINV